MRSKSDYVVTCPSCGIKSMEKWGDHYICRNCGAYRIMINNEPSYSTGLDAKKFEDVVFPEEAVLIANGMIPGTKKVVINRCYGGFGLSDKAYEWLINNRDWVVTEYDDKGNYINKDADIIDVSTSKHCILNHKYSSIRSFYDKESRTDRDIIDCVEELGSDVASGKCAELRIVEIPENVDFVINDYDGNEIITEKHRTW